MGGKSVRGRQYPWGVVDIEDSEHSDFTHLKRFLIQTHMQVKYFMYSINVFRKFIYFIYL